MRVKIVVLAIMALVGPRPSRFMLSAQQTPPRQGSDRPSRSVWDGVYTEEQANRGVAVYLQQCSNCHGQELAGADMSPALTGPTFTSNWNGLTVGDLFERIRITMPADRPGKLTRQQTSDVLAYVLGANKFPVGKTELPRELQVLKEILFESTKSGRANAAGLFPSYDLRFPALAR